MHHRVNQIFQRVDVIKFAKIIRACSLKDLLRGLSKLIAHANDVLFGLEDLIGGLCLACVDHVFYELKRVVFKWLAALLVREVQVSETLEVFRRHD